MRRVGASALLIACLVTFLCPAVGKANVATGTKAPDCCSKMSGCKMTHEQTSHHHPCGHESQPSSCCTVSCSTLNLFCLISERFFTRRFNGRTFAIDDASASTRIERPPDSAAADLIFPTAFGSAQYTRALRASSRSRGFTKSQQEKIMKYLLLIAAIMTLTSATTISSSDAGCCGGGACCPGVCCITMTR